MRLVDDLGRTVIVSKPPQRIVSLVPSDTYTVQALGAGARLIGRTSYCDEGPAAVVGGTKDADVEKILALSPDLVIANQEENSRATLEALANAHVKILVSLPRTVRDGVAHVARLARVLGVAGNPDVKELIRRGYAMTDAPPATRRAFVPIWMDPLMTINADTFGSDALAHAGVGNAFGDRLRLYPLAADLGKSAPKDAGGRDVRYPRVTLDEIKARGAELIVLPDEPHAFSADDEAVLRGALPDARVVRIAGKDLFWYGAWTIDAIPRLSSQLS